MNLFTADLPERLAAEYVIGTLRGGARRRFDALLPAHPRLRDAVAAWETRLLPLALAAAPVAPSAGAWVGIETRLGWQESPPPGQPRLPAQVRLWRSIAALATVVAILMGAIQRFMPSAPPLIVVLHATSGEQRVLVASLSADHRELAVRPLQRVAVSSRQSLELWALPKAGAPKSLGLVAPDGLTGLSQRHLPPDTKGLAVSVEPLGGSPTGAPTGPVLFAGDLTL
jgi:anti-sigma-K factor RskA